MRNYQIKLQKYELVIDRFQEFILNYQIFYKYISTKNAQEHIIIETFH